MSEIDKLRWRQMATATKGFADLLGRHKREHGQLHDPDIIHGASDQTALIINELPKARNVAPVEAGYMAAAGLRLAHVSGLSGESKQRMTTEAICTLGSLRMPHKGLAIPTDYANQLQGALYRYGDADLIKEAKEREKERGVLSGSWDSADGAATVHSPGTPWQSNSPGASAALKKFFMPD